MTRPAKRISKLASLFTLFLMSACASTLAPLVAPNVDTDANALEEGAYRLDRDHAALTFRVDHLGFSDYVGRFERFDATLDFDPEQPEAARVEAIIQMTSLDVANDEFAETLKGPQWFHTARYPEALFVSTAIEITGDNTGIMTGDLTLRGKTAPVSLNVVFNGGARDRLRRGAYIVGFSAVGAFDRTVFDVDRFSGVVGDEVTIAIEAEFMRREND